MATRTAPAVGTGTPAYVHVAFRFIDQSGDLRTVSHDIAPADATNVKIEALAAAVAAVSNASLYSVEVTQMWSSVPAASNATNATKDSVFDNIVYQLKNTANQSVRGFIPAPQGGLFLAGTDQIDVAEAALTTYTTALADVYDAGGYTIVGARYTERREINEQVRF